MRQSGSHFRKLPLSLVIPPPSLLTVKVLLLFCIWVAVDFRPATLYIENYRFCDVYF